MLPAQFSCLSAWLSGTKRVTIGPDNGAIAGAACHVDRWRDPRAALGWRILTTKFRALQLPDHNQRKC